MCSHVLWTCWCPDYSVKLFSLPAVARIAFPVEPLGFVKARSEAGLVSDWTELNTNSVRHGSSIEAAGYSKAHSVMAQEGTSSLKKENL